MYYHSRGRDFKPAGSTLKDEDGVPLSVVPAGPPQLFPPAPYLPPLPQLTEVDEALLQRKRSLEKAYKSSPYFLSLPGKKRDSGELEVERYSERLSRAPASEKLPLSSVLTLQARYFPSELYARAKRGRGRAAAAAAAAAVWEEGGGGGGSKRLEALAEAEQRAEADGPAAGEEEEEGVGGRRRLRKVGQPPGEEEPAPEEGQDEEREEEDEDEEAGFDCDLGPNAFDDDEGYGDGEDGGGDAEY